MASFAEEQKLRAHIELIEADGDYKAYFSQGSNENGDSCWYLTNDSDKAAPDALLDAKVAELTAIVEETHSGEGPSDFDAYTSIHFDDSISVSGVNYRTWFVDANADYFKADNGNSDSIVQITDSDEISTLLTDSGYVA